MGITQFALESLVLSLLLGQSSMRSNYILLIATAGHFAGCHTMIASPQLDTPAARFDEVESRESAALERGNKRTLRSSTELGNDEDDPKSTEEERGLEWVNK